MSIKLNNWITIFLGLIIPGIWTTAQTIGVFLGWVLVRTYTIPFSIFLVMTLVILYLNWGYLVSVMKKSIWLGILMTIIYSLASGLAIMSWRTDRLGFVTWSNYAAEFSDKHWYFATRVDPMFPFDNTGMTFIDENKTLSIPEGYVTRTPVNGKGWYDIVTYRYVIWFILWSFLVGMMTAAVVSRYLKTEDFTRGGRTNDKG